MKLTNRVSLLLLAAALVICANDAFAQSTDGTVSFSVQTTNYTATYSPKNVAVVWVVDSNGKFVKTLCRHAATRINYLYKWIASRGAYTTVDGVTSSTLTTQPQTHAVTWNCRGTNGLVVADGKYTFCIEYTSANAQGPVCSNFCSFVKGAVGVTTNYTGFANGGGTFTNMSLSYSPYSEVGILALTPASGLTSTTVPLFVSVTNQTLNPATFTVTVSNLTSASQIGTLTISNLASRAATNAVVNWATTGLSAGYYSVRTTIARLAYETNVTDNSFSRTIALSEPNAGDLAVIRILPQTGFAYASVPVQVLITNAMTNAASPFTVSLSNVTSTATLLATQHIVTLAPKAVTNVLLTWNTGASSPGTYWLKACTSPLTNETNTADNWLTNSIVLRDPVHDIAIRSVAITPMVPPNVTSNIVIAITNKGDVSESFSVTVDDITGEAFTVGSKATNIAVAAGISVAIPWNTAGAPIGYHTLRSGLTVVSGETNRTDNTNTFTVIVASGIETNSLSAKNSGWKYFDQGLDITGAPWKSADYFDGFWPSGAAPLGYSLTNIATTVGYGGTSSNRNITTYFRREFTLDYVPLSVTGRMMRTHGAVLYLNGTEIARQAMPAGAIGYATAATGTVSGASATNYFTFAIPTNVLVTGRNLLAAELHLAAPTNTTAGFSVEFLAVLPKAAITNLISPSALTPDGPALSGDAAGVSVTLRNGGGNTSACTVLIRDVATGLVLGSRNVGPLIPGETVTVRLTLSTLNAATGNRTLQAITVANGVTNLATVATAPFTLSAPDFSARTVAAAGSIGGRCNAVAASGNTVFLGCGATLEAWDVADPASPVRKAVVRLPGIIEDLVASNAWVYAAAGASGVQIVDATSHTQLLHRATFDTTGHARRLALDGNLLYVADVLGGVRVLNVAAPAAPSLAGAFQTTGPAQALAPLSPRLLVLDGQSGLLNLHAASPAAMSVTGTYSRITSGLALTAVSGAALAADANGGLFRISTVTPSHLTAVTNTLLPAAARGLATSGSALYAAAGAQGLLTLDATTLEIKAVTDVGGDAADVAVLGSTLYVAAGFNGAYALNVSAPFAPALLGVFTTGARGSDAAASGSTLYVAGDEGGLQIHRLQNLEIPTLLGFVSSVGNPRCVAVSYPNLLVGDGLYGLKLFDIANPAAPVLRGTYEAAALSHIRRVAVAGNRAVLTDGKTVELLSIATPATPALLASLQPGGFVFDLAAVDGEVYAACGGAGLKALRMDTLAVDSTVATPGPATGVAAVSNRLTVCCGPAGWQTLNIDNAASPTLVKATAGRAVFDAAAAGPLVYLADGARTALVANVSAPLTPVVSAAFGHLSLALRVRAVSGLVVTAEDEAGLSILNASPGDINLNGIPDEWEQQIVSASLQTNGPVRSVLDVDLHSVGPNGFTFYQSYLAGLTPTDPNSVLALSAATPAQNGSGQITIQWHSVAGKRYTLYKSADLAGGFTAIPAATGVVASGALTSFTDAITSARAFYMVVLTP